MSKVVLATKKYKEGYEVKREVSIYEFEAVPLTFPVDDDIKELIGYINKYQGKSTITKAAYTSSGDYIGDERMAHFLIIERGIKPEKINPTYKVCSIGFCESEQKWYGWSHRAICGFGIGSVVEEGDCTASSGWTKEYLIKHPEKDLSLPVGFKAKNLEDAKRMAIAFAESVG